MPILVFVELDRRKIKKTSLEAVNYSAVLAETIHDEVYSIVLGETDRESLTTLGTYGSHKVIHITGDDLNIPSVHDYGRQLADLMEQYGGQYLIAAQSALADPVAALVAARCGAAISTNVSSLPVVAGDTCQVQRVIFSGKAYETVKLKSDKKIISIRKNTVENRHFNINPEIITSHIKSEGSTFGLKITGADKAKEDIPLSEADIVVSGGRGLKGPENWGMIEELAEVLGAAKACSKPVSDANWRPHHEHVGQTGIKVSPDLYVAIGISGAIQHLAGVSASKVIVVINIDPEAPFFKSADYGIIGDAFEIVPELINVLKKYI